jgi:hypothetical protein
MASTSPSPTWFEFSNPWNGKTADRSCCHCPIRRPRPAERGGPTARATWGDVCSLARRISWFDESGCLYETCTLVADGVLYLPLIRCPSFDVSLVAWDFMVINNIFWVAGHNMRDLTLLQDKT